MKAIRCISLDDLTRMVEGRIDVDEIILTKGDYDRLAERIHFLENRIKLLEKAAVSERPRYEGL